MYREDVYTNHVPSINEKNTEELINNLLENALIKDEVYKIVLDSLKY